MSKRSKGFTLIELLVVIAIISLLSSIVLASLNSARAKARDAVRMSDMHQMQVALDLYFNSFGQYPDSDNLGCGGWDTPGDGTFITPLVTNKFLPTHLKDPSSNGACAGYFYYRYNPGWGGCDTARGYFYVLAAGYMEFSGALNTTKSPSSPGWSCSNNDWTSSFAWVTGKFEQ